MKTKYLLYFLLGICATLLSSCGGVEDDCPVIPITEYVLGTWKVNSTSVMFKADGAYIDDDNILDKSNVQTNLISAKNYTITDSNLVLSVTTVGGVSLSTTYTILNMDCNTFDIEWISGTTKFTLSR